MSIHHVLHHQITNFQPSSHKFTYFLLSIYSLMPYLSIPMFTPLFPLCFSVFPGTRCIMCYALHLALQSKGFEMSNLSSKIWNCQIQRRISFQHQLPKIFNKHTYIDLRCYTCVMPAELFPCPE